MYKLTNSIWLILHLHTYLSTHTHTNIHGFFPLSLDHALCYCFAFAASCSLPCYVSVNNRIVPLALAQAARVVTWSAVWGQRKNPMGPKMKIKRETQKKYYALWKFSVAFNWHWLAWLLVSMSVCVQGQHLRFVMHRLLLLLLLWFAANCNL